MTAPSLPDRLRSLAPQCRKQMPQGLPRTLDDMAREVEEIEDEVNTWKRRYNEAVAWSKGDGK